MDKQTYLDKVTKRDRNLNIARLYFDEDKSLAEIQADYPELSKSRIWQIARNNADKFQKEEI
jgi:predicted DNA-binding protein YlxM (UPF0122 family)